MAKNYRNNARNGNPDPAAQTDANAAWAAQQAAMQAAAQQAAAWWAAQQQAQAGAMPWPGAAPAGWSQPAAPGWGQAAPDWSSAAMQAAAWGAAPAAAPAHGTGPLGWLSNRQMEQFILGLLLGGAAAYVLGDADKRARLMRMVMKLYAGVAGSVEEFKEQIADLKAEVAAEHGGFED